MVRLKKYIEWISRGWRTTDRAGAGYLPIVSAPQQLLCFSDGTANLNRARGAPMQVCEDRGGMLSS
jgi:hypothetical protein